MLSLHSKKAVDSNPGLSVWNNNNNNKKNGDDDGNVVMNLPVGA